jgi:Xaa-Pro aminopeptidase
MGTIGEPTSAQQDLYQRYVDACTKAIQGLKLGMRGADASDGFNREFRGRGLSLLGWATGFGLGYGPVEPPYLSSAEELELHPGMVVSLEPMIKEGIRANWEIVVEESGARILDSPFAAERLFVARQV